MEWLSLIGSILGGLIGGMFTFLGVKLTLKYDKEKEKKEIIKKAITEKPRLEKVYANCKSTTSKISCDCNVLTLKIEGIKNNKGVLEFLYNNDFLDLNKLTCIEIELKNTGFTEIEEVCISSNNYMNLSIVDYNKKEYFINNHLLNYVVYAEKRYIKPNQNIKVKIYYIKEQIESIISTYPFKIWLHDVNDRYWKQPLEVQQNDISIENTILSNRKDFIEHTNIDKAIDCFKEPHNW